MTDVAQDAAKETPNAAPAEGQSLITGDLTPKPETKPEASAKPDVKEGEEPKKQDAVPEKYEVKLPEGALFDQAHAEMIAQKAKEIGLSPEHAQALVDREHQILKDIEQKHDEGHKARMQEWVSQAKADKEIGGDDTKFKENVEIASRGLKKFTTPEFAKILDDSGFGNHPELLRVFYRIGKELANDKMIIPSAEVGNIKSSHEENIYGKQ